MTISILVCTHGDESWADLAARRAVPSASDQGAHEVLVRHHVEGNLAEVRNEAAKRATGEWLCFLDADDELGPAYIAAMKEAIESAGDAVASMTLFVPAVQYVDVVREDTIAEGETGLITKSEPPVVLNDSRPLFVINRAVIGTLVPRELFLHLGGFRGDLPIYEDWEMVLRCERAGAELVDVPDAVYRVYRRPDSRNQGTEAQRIYWKIRREYEPR